MKYIIPTILILLTSLNAIAVEPNTPISLSGTVMKASFTQKVQTFLIDVNIDHRHVSGVFDLSDMKGNVLNSWSSTPTEVVKVGRNNLQRVAILNPNQIYGIETSCYVKGYLFHDTDEDVYTAKKLCFVYRDPASKQKRVEEVFGTIQPRSVEGNFRLYDIRLRWGGDVFGPYLSGTVTKNKDSVSYLLTGKNMDASQFESFTNWWLHCAVPSL